VGASGMEQIESIILYCLKKLNGERTIFSIYHLLHGKKSSQTIQDVHLFSLKKFFGVCEGMTRESFETIVHRLHEKGWISHSAKQRFLLTPLGESLLAKHPCPPYLNGWENHQLATLFWERLSLFVQVVSNLAFQETNYIPIQKNKDVQAWIKSVLREIRIPKNRIGMALYKELLDCFADVEGIDPALVVFRLTGYQQIGLTSWQAAKKFKLDVIEYHIGFIHTIHYLLDKIKRDAKRFPLLKFLIDDVKENNELTVSSNKTMELLSKGYSLEMIESSRRLKMSKIEDHLVELAFHLPDFSIDPYVEKALQNQILEISRQSGSRQLKVIKDKMEKASYFQIRLVLAKYGGG
jgi:uncharacterized protein YpbB